MRIEDSISGDFISVDITEFDDFTDIDKSKKSSAGGKRKTQTGGKRFIADEKFFVTMSQWSTLSGMLGDGNAVLYYTPTTTPEYMTSLQFPLEVVVDNPNKENATVDGKRKFVIKIKIESVDYV